MPTQDECWYIFENTESVCNNILPILISVHILYAFFFCGPMLLIGFFVLSSNPTDESSIVYPSMLLVTMIFVIVPVFLVFIYLIIILSIRTINYYLHDNNINDVYQNIINIINNVYQNINANNVYQDINANSIYP